MIEKVKTVVKNSRKHVIALSAFAAILILSFHSVIFADGFIQYADFTTPIQADRYISTYFSSWNTFGSHSTIEFIPRILLYIIPFTITLLFGLSMAILEKFLALFPLFLAFVSMYVLSFHLTKNGTKINVRIAICFIAALIFALNPWVVSETRHFTLIWGYALAPVVFLLFSEYLENNSRKYLVVTALVLAVSAVTPLWLMLDFGMIILFTIFNSAVKYRTESVRAAIFQFTKLAKVIALCIIFGAFWILPLVSSSLTQSLAPSYVNTNEVLDMLSRNSEIADSARLMGDWWPQASWQPVEWQGIWRIASFILPILAIAGVVGNWRNKYVIFFAVVTVITLFLSLGTQGGDFYSWLSFESPVAALGWMLRNPSHWEALLAFGYSVLAVFALSGFASLLQWNKNNHILMKGSLVFMLLIIGGAFMFYAWPTVSGYSEKVLHPVDIPNDYTAVNELIDGQSGKALWLYPLESSTLTWSGASTNFDARSSSLENIGMSEQNAHNFIGFLYDRLQKNTTLFGEAVDILGAHYVMFHNDTNVPASIALKALDGLKNQSGLSYMKIVGSISIFENDDYQPEIFAPAKTIGIIGGLEALEAFASSDTKISDVAIEFLDQTGNVPHGDVFEFRSDETPNLNALGALVAAPYDYTTHHNPARMWSKAGTSDPLHGPWHSYLKQRGIDNWDFDYSRGIVLTWSPGTVDENATGNIIAGFDTLFRNASISGGLTSMGTDGHAEINISEGLDQNWKKLSTAAIALKPSTYYRSAIALSAENVNKLHGKVIFYSANGTELGNERIVSETNGDISTTRFEKIFATPSETVSANIQFWVKAAEEPSQFNITDFALYDMSDFTKPNEIVMPVAADGRYEIWLRYFENTKGGTMKLLADDLEFLIDTKGDSNRFVWKKLGTLPLNARSTIKLQNVVGFNAVNIVALVPETSDSFASGKTVYTSLSDLKIPASSAHVEYTKREPTRYEVAVNATAPFTLAFTEAYNPLWFARIDDGTVVQSAPLYSVINGFWINRTGSFSVSIEYDPQRWVYVGFGITIVSLVASAIFAIRKKSVRKYHSIKAEWKYTYKPDKPGARR